MTTAWNNYKQTLSGFTPEELEILRSEYEKYLAERYKWEWKDDAVMSFDDWFRASADEARDRAKYQD